MSVVIYLSGVALFVIVFSLTRLSESFGTVTQIAGQALGAIRNPALDDDAKERVARDLAWSLLKQGALIVAKAVVTVATAVAPFWFADALSITPWEESIAFASRWDVLVITTAVMLCTWLIWRYRRSARRP